MHRMNKQEEKKKGRRRMIGKERKTEGLSSHDVWEIEKIVSDLYEAYYSSDRITLFSYLDTEFQKLIPLNYFLIHEEFNAELGNLMEISEIMLLNEGQATVSCKIQQPKGIAEINLSVKKDYGGWRIKGNSLFRRRIW